MSSTLKVGVLGTGSLGKEHVRIYKELAAQGEIELVGVYDSNQETARSIASNHRVRAFDCLDALAEATDALSVVTPTSTHYPITKQLLESGKHVLVEKPMTDEGDQAAELVNLSHRQKRVLQVGHVERFNPVFNYLQEVATDPRFIESHRLSPYPARSTDIGVVLDLMIHDLDVVLSFVQSDIEDFDAIGIPVLSSSEDIANVRIRFRNGCVANLTASRISPDRMRKIRVFSGGATSSYVSLDYSAQEGFIYRLARNDEAESSFLKKLIASRKKDFAVVSEFAGKRIVREPVPIDKGEPLKLELQSFVECVQRREHPVVSGESARQALDLALEITRQIQTKATQQSKRP